TQGIPPESSAQRRIPEIYHLSNERRLYLRLTSPHEYDETAEQFLEKTRAKMGDGRWCYAGPFQPNAFKNMPDIVQSVRAFMSFFEPERVRVAFLSPNRHGDPIDDLYSGQDLSRQLLSIPRVEVVALDGCWRRLNIDPPRRLNFDPGTGAGVLEAGCAQL
ncbi:MAG: hypothetical protein VW475_09635, partial [Curvibacter sp.]